jgi:hypothetical protein
LSRDGEIHVIGFLALVGAVAVAWFLLPVIRHVGVVILGLTAPIKLVADAHTRTELARHGVEPASLHPSLIAAIAEEAVELSTISSRVDRTELAFNIAALANIAAQAQSGAFDGMGETSIWESVIRRQKAMTPQAPT